MRCPKCHLVFEGEPGQTLDSLAAECGKGHHMDTERGCPDDIGHYMEATTRLRAQLAVIKADLAYLKQVYEGNVAYPQNGPLASAVRRLTDHV